MVYGGLPTQQNNMNTKITIGIPAYNEENNISVLIDMLLAQNFTSIILEKIIVISDGSTDKTASILKSYKNSKIKPVINKNRQGLVASQNKIAKLANSEILVLLDADVLPKDKNFLNEIIKPIISDPAVGLVGANTESLKGKGLFEKIIANSHEYKKSIYFSLTNKNNLYLCHGRARAFSKKFYKSITWPENAPEDSYSYLFCIKNNFKFVYQNSAVVMFRSPNNLKDHKKQSDRFFDGNKQLIRIFGKNMVNRELFIPNSNILKNTIKGILNSPILLPLYFALFIFIKLFSQNKFKNITKWEIAESSKTLK